jgi:hypothetical protein
VTHRRFLLSGSLVWALNQHRGRADEPERCRADTLAISSRAKTTGQGDENVHVTVSA